MTLPAMMLLGGVEGGFARRAHDDPPAGQALADVVVGVALEPQGDAARQERAEGLAGGAGEGDVDGVVGQAGAGVPLGDLVAEHGADGAVDVADRQLDAHRGAVFEGVGGELDQLVVERLVEAVVLRRWCGAGRRLRAVRAGGRSGVRSRP